MVASTADVPVGGGTVVAAGKVVVTQPVEGEFRVLSAVCAHQGRTVGSVADGPIVRPCHADRFRVTDGSVAAGPATDAAAGPPDHRGRGRRPAGLTTS
ncbi:MULTISPECIES: Rieske (2Fe-2S) protein [Streptomyces]|uniref:Rieske domain-containing protein n=1 Tax=Streptomyces kanasensis TaxID=936756 RepID=A0A100Y3Y6_9ACTN|nr:Rieske (2Fe-2S) protein [Streptomyces changanensis]KUH37264.1 hypothetical protein ATE80_19295 [Streptomyces kanasensis]